MPLPLLPLSTIFWEYFWTLRSFAISPQMQARTCLSALWEELSTAREKAICCAPCPCFPFFKIVVAKGSGAVSTADAYKNIDSVPPLNNEKTASAFCSEDINAIAASCGNIFEKTVNLPEIGEIKGIMKECGALCSCMTGSGSAVFGIFTKNASAAGCADRLKAMGYFAAAADPVPYGVKRIDG